MNAAPWLLLVLVNGVVMALGPYTEAECDVEAAKHAKAVCIVRGHPMIRPPDPTHPDDGTDNRWIAT